MPSQRKNDAKTWVPAVVAAMMIMLTSATTASAGCRGNLVTLTNLDLIPVNLALKNSDTYSEYITCYFPSGMMWDYRYPSNFRVSRRPLHGVAGVNNGATGSGFAYKPADGYIGHELIRSIA